MKGAMHLRSALHLHYTTAIWVWEQEQGCVCRLLAVLRTILHPFLMRHSNQAINPSQAAEWGRARVALVCEPGIEALFDLLQPNAANFLRPFSLARAQVEHRTFRRQLEALGVQVIDLRQALLVVIGRLRLEKRRSQMDEMHLDTYFAVLGPDLCLLCETRLHKSDEPEVDAYVPDGDPDNFRYRRAACQRLSDAIPIDFAALTGGYGGPHCSTQVIVRD